MKSIIVSSNSSGGGKTTFTLGFMRALEKKGYSVQGYKVGPDYIDTDFHRLITKKNSRNLDSFLMGEDGVIESYLRGHGDLGVIEGVMGLYDGKGIDGEGSTDSISKMLNLPIVLVITPKAQSTTIAAELKGLIEFKNANIVGVVFNKISERYYLLLKKIVETFTKLKVLGFVPNVEEVKFKSRHLGLVQGVEVENLEEKINVLSDAITENVDLDLLIEDFKEAKHKEIDRSKFKLKNKNLKIGVAYDEAFRFYYKENLELLENIGEVKYFSPIRDEKLPSDIDFLYIGGGYPEVFKDKLEANKSLLKDIKQKLENGLNCYAECGGLMYLTQNIDGSSMVGFFKGNSYMTNRLNNFGYAKLEIKEENLKLPKKLSINCHEFHKSKVHLEETPIYEVSKEDILGDVKKWNCGYVKNNTLAGYPHIHLFGNMDFIENILMGKEKKNEL